MKVQFIIYSHTGHTKTVAESVKKKLLATDHHVAMDFVLPKEKLDLKAEYVNVETIPDPQGQDVVIIGTPVHGGRASAPIRTFLSQVDSFEGIRIILLVTHFFRSSWGAVQTLQELRKLCKNKGGEVIGDSHIRWFSINRKREIKKSTDHLCSLINN